MKENKKTLENHMISMKSFITKSSYQWKEILCFTTKLMHKNQHQPHKDLVISKVWLFYGGTNLKECSNKTLITFGKTTYMKNQEFLK